MNKKILVVLCVGIASVISGCNGGTTSSQNMPVGGTPFTGTFSPGIGNLTTGSTVNMCNYSLGSFETLTFTVNESGPTIFQDGSLYPNQNVMSGSFNNPVNQNNPCFTGTVTYSGCSYAQSGVVKFNGCSVYLVGSGYQFTATYYLYTTSGTLILSGSVNATK